MYSEGSQRRWQGWLGAEAIDYFAAGTKFSKMGTRPLAIQSKLLAAASLLVSAYLTADGVHHLTERKKLEPLRHESPGRAAASPVPPPADARDLAQGILTRNIFDSTSGPLAWDPEPVEDPPEAPPDTQDEVTELQACSASLQLLGVAASSVDPARSVGIIRRDGVTQLARNGQAVGDVEVVALGPSHAYLRGADGTLCLLSLFAAGGAATPTTPSPALPVVDAPKENKKAPLFSAEELESGVVPLGGDRFRIDRRLVDRGLVNPGRVAKGAKFAPESDKGSVVGVRVTRARSDSLLYRLGVREGDVLRSVNGVAVNGMDAMLSLYALLKEQSNLTLALTRNGRARSLHYAFE